MVALVHTFSYSSLAFKLLPTVIALGFMLAISSYILYKSPLKHFRPGIVMLMLGVALLTLGLAVIFSHALPYSLSRWFLLPSGVLMACAVLLMAVGAQRTTKESKQAPKPSIEAEGTIWPPPPRHPSK